MYETEVRRIIGNVVAGVDGARVDLTEIDMRGFHAVRIIMVIGAVTGAGALSLWVKGSNTTATYGAGTIDDMTTTAQAVVGAGASMANRVSMIEIWKPRTRFLKPQYQRTVANVVLDAVLYEKHTMDFTITEVDTTYVVRGQVFNNPVPSLV